ncbi:MAG: nucleoside deaminase [Pseudomonadota bacterium]
MERNAPITNDARFMGLALEEARSAGVRGEVPVGAVLVDNNGAVVAGSGNTTRSVPDPTGHAEMNVLRAAALAQNNFRLAGTTLFVTLEPCAMCAGAISHARVERLVIAASDPKGGGVWHGPKVFDHSTCHWRPAVDHGPFAAEAGTLLRDFFRARRK